jgi:hypothetical protein
VNPRGLHRPCEAGNELRHLRGIQPLHGGRLVGGESTAAVGQADPVDVHQANPARYRLLEVVPPLQAGPLQVDERLGVAPLMRLGDQQAGGAAGRARPEPAGLDQEHRADTRLRAGRRRRDTKYPAADDQDIGPGIGNGAITAPENGPLARSELITPDRPSDSHDPILGDPADAASRRRGDPGCGEPQRRRRQTEC